MRDLTRREPYADGCDFNPRGVVCRDEVHDCAHCGWFPAEAKRRKLARLGREPLRRGRQESE